MYALLWSSSHSLCWLSLVIPLIYLLKLWFYLARKSMANKILNYIFYNWVISSIYVKCVYWVFYFRFQVVTFPFLQTFLWQVFLNVFSIISLFNSRICQFFYVIDIRKAVTNGLIRLDDLFCWNWMFFLKKETSFCLLQKDYIDDNFMCQIKFKST